MHIYLVQHGAAVPKDENPEKPLSDSGRDDIKKMASFLARSHVSAARVIHSGKLRALETALLLAEVLGPGNVDRMQRVGLGQAGRGQCQQAGEQADSGPCPRGSSNLWVA